MVQLADTAALKPAKWEFKSLFEYKCLLGGTVYTLVLETNAERYKSSTLLEGTYAGMVK